MGKSARIQQDRLKAMESEFRVLLSQCLAECAKGRWGLFGQNSLVDSQDRYWTWSEAQYLRTLAYDIRGARSNGGEVNPLAERFLGLCGPGKPDVEGEPKLALALLREIKDEAELTSSF